MDMRMMLQGLPPIVQHSKESNRSAQTFGIGRNPPQRLRHGPEQNPVNHRLVLIRQGGDLRRNAEDHMKVLHRQEFGLAVPQPLFLGQTLALRTMTIAARAVADANVLALIALFDMAT